jgi:S-adenosyl methyltransferase
MTTTCSPSNSHQSASAYNALVPAGITPRSHVQVTGLFGGLSLIPPAVVPISEWRPTAGSWYLRPADLYAGLATCRG